MKNIIEISVKTKKARPEACKVDLLAVGLFSDGKKLTAPADSLDAKLNGAIKRVIKLGDFKGKQGSTSVLYTGGAIAAQRLLLVGLGEKKKAGADTVRKAAAAAANTAVNLKAATVGLCLHQPFGSGIDPVSAGRAAAEGAHFGAYRYDEFVTGDKDGRAGRLAVEIIDAAEAGVKKLRKGAVVGEVIGAAQSYARTLANRPGNVINPEALAAEARKVARETAGLSCTVFDHNKLKAKGMGGILAVGSGSKSPPRLIVLKYKSAAGKKAATVGLVGKAITFDSGGISIKPSANMHTMKLDKTGGIVVLAAIKAAAELKLKLNVCAVIPSAENLPGPTSYRPGDIIKTYSGKTVEVQNTDAEGRMILCDGLARAVEEKCDPIIDIATLTGACMVALGKHHAGLMGNDDKLIQQLKEAAGESGEKVWPMPSGEEYAEEMKSKIADLKNIGSKYGGACTAAAFLGRFVENAKWAHLDIAGMDHFEKPDAYSSEGSSGYGVRLLASFLIDRAKAQR